MSAVLANQGSTFAQVPIADLGSISLRVVVLPQKETATLDADEVLVEEPLDPSEDGFAGDSKKSPLASYLESSRGRQCCVFLVNGQRQDALDNSFISQDLGFKFLRSRMMIIVDVDGLTQHALGSLMQGSRQGFYRGEEWDAIIKRVKATLKGDPDLRRLEQEAEEQISELEAGDEKVRHTLDQLIDAHHDYGPNLDAGAGVPASGESDGLGLKLVSKDGVVFLTTPDQGSAADYPVLVSRPGASLIRLRPNVDRTITIQTLPGNAWQARSEFHVVLPKDVPELSQQQTILAECINLKLRFTEPVDFDAEQYPVDALVQIDARFNGIKEVRRLELKVLVKPDVVKPTPELLDVPTTLRVASRTPIKISVGDADTHVRLNWNGRDELINGPSSTWHFEATQTAGANQCASLHFSSPHQGRFTLLIAANETWAVGDLLKFRVVAIGPGSRRLECEFEAHVLEKAEPPQRLKKAPRVIKADVMTGAIRRPPYQLAYIKKKQWEDLPCWGGQPWSGSDPGYLIEPTDTKPLTLIINTDMEALQDYRQYITKEFKETEIERRVTKYTSHVAFHLYQMYLNLVDRRKSGAPIQDAERIHSDEIRRVSTTLLQLMRVSR